MAVTGAPAADAMDAHLLLYTAPQLGYAPARVRTTQLAEWLQFQANGSAYEQQTEWITIPDRIPALVE